MTGKKEILEVHARWEAWENDGLEHCVMRETHEGVTLEGVVVGARGSLYGGYYRVATDARFFTREVLVRYAGGYSLHVSVDDQGRWYDYHSKREIEELWGCHDVDIGITPATNMLPIKRLKLQHDRSADIIAAYVPLPDQIEKEFFPIPARQRYTRLGKKRYRYEGLFRDFKADLDFDQVGLVLDYPGTFRRVT